MSSESNIDKVLNKIWNVAGIVITISTSVLANILVVKTLRSCIKNK